MFDLSYCKKWKVCVTIKNNIAKKPLCFQIQLLTAKLIEIMKNLLKSIMLWSNFTKIVGECLIVENCSILKNWSLKLVFSIISSGYPQKKNTIAIWVQRHELENYYVFSTKFFFKISDLFRAIYVFHNKHNDKIQLLFKEWNTISEHDFRFSNISNSENFIWILFQ